MLTHEQCEGIYGLGHMMYLCKTGPIWQTLEHQGLTAFAIVPDCEKARTWLKALSDAHYGKAHESNLLNADIMAFNQKDIYGPTSYDKLVMMLSTFLVVIGILFGRRSYIRYHLEQMLDHILDEKRLYDTHCTRWDKYWFVRILFGIDIAIQEFIHHCGHVNSFGEVQFKEYHAKTLRQIQDDIIRHNFTVQLPTRFTCKDHLDKERLLIKDDLTEQPSQARANNQRNINTKNTANHRQNSNRPFQPQQQAETMVTNSSINSEWKELTHDFNIPAYLYQKDTNSPIPAHNGKNFCVIYHTVGRCKRGRNCAYEHTCPTNCGKGWEFTEYLKIMVASSHQL
jgi:hypothetical protein